MSTEGQPNSREPFCSLCSRPLFKESTGTCYLFSVSHFLFRYLLFWIFSLRSFNVWILDCLPPFDSFRTSLWSCSSSVWFFFCLVLLLFGSSSFRFFFCSVLLFGSFSRSDASLGSPFDRQRLTAKPTVSATESVDWFTAEAVRQSLSPFRSNWKKS